MIFYRIYIYMYMYICICVYIYVHTTLECLSMLGQSLIVQSIHKTTPSAKYHLLSLMEITRGGAGNRLQRGRAREPQQVEGVHHPVSVEYNLRLFNFRPLAACTALFTELHHSLPHLQKTCHLIHLCAHRVSSREPAIHFCPFLFVNNVTQLLQSSLKKLIPICQSQNSGVKYSE